MRYDINIQTTLLHNRTFDWKWEHVTVVVVVVVAVVVVVVVTVVVVVAVTVVVARAGIAKYPHHLPPSVGLPSLP